MARGLRGVTSGRMSTERKLQPYQSKPKIAITAYLLVTSRDWLALAFTFIKYTANTKKPISH
jgi:hypothetical protein